MIKVDRSTGVATTDDGWKLTFHGNKIQVQKELVDVLVTYEPLVGGINVVIYNDLENRGLEPSKAKTVIGVAKSALEAMGFSVELG